MEQQAPICATLVEQKRLDLLLKDAEFSLLEEVLKVLKPFKDVTVQVSAEKYVTISAIRPLLHHLTENALKVEGSDSLAVHMMKEEMTKNLSSRYQGLGITELLNFACFVDPRFKSMPFLDEAKTQLLHDNVLAEMMKHVTPDPEQEEDTVSDSECVAEKEPVAKKPKTGLGKLLGGTFSRPGEKRRMSIREKAEQERKRYIEEPSPYIDENALVWWKRNHNRFPAIAVIARRVVCIPATSTPSERLFSKAGHIINSKRASLEPENASTLCFLAENLP